jgi:hypothetical protein
VKRFVLFVLVLAVLLTGCAPKETPVKRLLWLTETAQTESYFAAQEYRKETGVDIEVRLTQSPDGTTAEMQALFASGAAPNVYTAYGGRTSAYYDIAMPLTLETNQYVPGILDVCKNSKGEVVAAPIFFWVQNGMWNITLAQKYGLDKYFPQNEERTWKIADLEAAMAELKAKSKTEYGVYFYAASGSGDYWMQLFEKAFGANPLYDKSGKFDVNNDNMRNAWTWMVDTVKKGYAPVGAEALTDDHFVAAQMEALVLFSGNSPGGAGDKYKHTMVSYPSVDGSFVPFAVAPTCHIAVKTGDAEMDAKAKKFVEWLASSKWTKTLAAPAQWTTRIDVTDRPLVADGVFGQDEFVWAKKMMAKYGVMNIGIGKTQYQAIRTLRAKKLAEVFAGKKDVAKGLVELQAEGEAILAGK